MKKVSILIHGFFKSERDMLKLSKNLSRLGHKVHLVKLPLTFNTLDDAFEIFLNEFKSISKEHKPHQKYNLIGHSTGGIIIRMFLNCDKRSKKINRCVFISTPNKGSRMASIASAYAKPVTKVLKTVNCLTNQNISKRELYCGGNIECGALIGKSKNLFIDFILKSENDGLICVEEVFESWISDIVFLKSTHREIHQLKATAILCHNFITTGAFR